MKPNLKVKNTYSRKKQRKPVSESKTNVYNVNVFCVNIFNITKDNSSSRAKPESSESEPSDIFDKLIKGPKYNVNNKSSFCSPEFSKKFFSQRQDTVEFYKSDAELSISTDISNHLFRDSKDSDVYTPTWLSPPDYCKIKNKLVKIEKEPKITTRHLRILNQKVTKKSKTSNRVQKKYPARRIKKTTHESPPSVPCTSSTPTQSKALSKNNSWLVTNFSPILPAPFNPKDFVELSNTNLNTGNEVINQNCKLGVTALIEGLENLGIETPHRKKFEEVNSGGQAKELFDYNSPISFPVGCHSEGLNEDMSQQLAYETCEEKDNGEIDYLHSNDQCPKISQILDVTSHQSEKEFSANVLEDSVYGQERTEEQNDFEGLESNQMSCKIQSPDGNHCDAKESSTIGPLDFKGFEDLGCSSVNSPEFKGFEDSEPELITDNNSEKLSSSNSISHSSERETSNEAKTDVSSRNSSLREESDTELDSESNVKSMNSSESCNDKNDKNNSHLEENNSPYDLEETNGSNDSIENNGIDHRLLECLKDSNFNETNQQELLDTSTTDEAVIPIPIVNTEIHVSKATNEGQDDSGVVKSNSKRTSARILKLRDSQPLGDMTNLAANNIKCKSNRDINKKSISSCKENETANLSLKNKFSLLPVTNELNDTMTKINLEAGKKWRRSLLRQKQPEARFERRVSISTDTLVRLIRESSLLCDLTNISKFSSNNTTWFINQDTSNLSPQMSGQSPDFNISMSRLNRIQRRRRRMYLSDMVEIPEECSDQSVSKCSEKDIFEEESIVKQDEGNTTPLKSGSTDAPNVDRSDVYETPPILRQNPEALSAITERKRNNRYRPRSFGECSSYSDSDQYDPSDEESNLFTSCFSKLDIEDDIDNLNDQDIEFIGKAGFLLRCGQQEPISFEEALPEQVLKTGQKIGEGVFGEVFMLKRRGETKSVIKIIPIEGSIIVNDSVQKRFEEVLSELIITEELSVLRENKLNCTYGFCELKRKYFLQGKYPEELLRLWKEYDDEKGSDNDNPIVFGPDQLYLALELAHAGEPVESFGFRSPQQALAIFLQTTFSLAVAESAFEFEHRDLHIGNVLVQTTQDRYVTFVLKSSKFECPTYGAKATIIDYTLSRISFREDVLFLDLEKDPELFTVESEEYQFDIYRHMRADLNGNWRDHEPKTNVRWLHYLVDKLSGRIKYKQKKTTKLYKEYMDKLLRLKEIILDFYSATDLAQHLIDSYSWTARLIRK